VSDFGDVNRGNIVKLVNPVYNPGAVRSSIVTYTDTDGKYVIFSSAGASGLLWQLPVGQLAASTSGDYKSVCAVLSGVTTTSTPVISENNIIYVGSNNGDGTGAVWAYNPGTATTTPGTPPTLAATIYNGDAVSGSMIVWSVSEEEPEPNHVDYVYFTTYADHSQDQPPVTNHNGYCFAVDLNSGTPSPSLVWNPATGGSYALQGFASDDGYLVYGDDGNRLYIFS
jgi:hypothetical protein